MFKNVQGSPDLNYRFAGLGASGIFSCNRFREVHVLKEIRHYGPESDKDYFVEGKPEQ